MPTPDSTPATVAATPAIGAALKTTVTLEEFGDYQCPPCGGLHPLLKQVKSAYGERVKFVFYHLPLTSVHKNALDAAHAAVAAGLQGKFWEMHDLLYENQKVWSELDDIRPVAKDFARQLGLDLDIFALDMDGPKVRAKVAADIQRATALKVDSTPTLFLDGQPVQNEKLSGEYLAKEINQRLTARK
jgi:protein-disulfide isomerase